jgi:hypothetical protein
MKTRVAIATGIAAGLFAAYLASSGASVRVHVALGLGLLLGFWVPALFVRRPSDLRRGRVLAAVILGAVALAVGSAITIAKGGLSTAVIQALASIPVLLALVAAHGFVVQRATRGSAV